MKSNYTEPLTDDENDNLNEEIKALIEKSPKPVTVTFIKKDGTERTMKCTRNLKLIPEDKHPKGVKKETGDVLPVFDLDKNDWRSFDLNDVVDTAVV
jgi:hypothetical protein